MVLVSTKTFLIRQLRPEQEKTAGEWTVTHSLKTCREVGSHWIGIRVPFVLVTGSNTTQFMSGILGSTSAGCPDGTRDTKKKHKQQNKKNTENETKQDKNQPTK